MQTRMRPPHEDDHNHLLTTTTPTRHHLHHHPAFSRTNATRPQQLPQSVFKKSFIIMITNFLFHMTTNAMGPMRPHHTIPDLPTSSKEESKEWGAQVSKKRSIFIIFN